MSGDARKTNGGGQATAAAAVAGSPNNHHHEEGSVAGSVGSVSVLTDASRMSVFAQAAMILRGQNPNAPILEGSDDADEDDDDDDDNNDRLLGVSVPGQNGSNNNNNLATSDHDSVKSRNTVTWKTSMVDEVPPMTIDFLKDDVNTMTYGRRIALYLMRYGWYYPPRKPIIPPPASTKKKDESALPVANGDTKPTSDHNTDPSLVVEEEKDENWLDACHPFLLRAMQNDMHNLDNVEQHYELSERANSTTTNKDNATAPESFYLAYPFIHARRETPSLAKAWAYFDHVALARYVDEDDDGRGRHKKKGDNKNNSTKLGCFHNPKLNRAEPGERQFATKLYSPLLTPHSQLGDFGLGIGLYFSTLRAITILCIAAGLLNIPNFLYYSSPEYNMGDNTTVDNVSWRFRGSAYCNNTEWVFCDTCDIKKHKIDKARYAPVVRVLVANDDAPFMIDINVNSSLDINSSSLAVANDATNTTTYAYLRNKCSQDNEQAAYVNYATLMLVLAGTFALNMYLKRMETIYDEDEQTAQDYSIIVRNPPGDATDPQEWHDWIRDAFDGAHLTACTIAVNNDLLVRALVQRREVLRQIELMVEPGTSLDLVTLAGLAAKEERARKFWGHVKAMILPGLPEIFARLTVITSKVQGLAQQDYPATQVFLTLETEAAQRLILSTLSIGHVDVARQKSASVKRKYRFRKKHLLDVAEPDEPSTVRWQDLNEKWKDRAKQQWFTMLCTIAAICAIAFLVYVLNQHNVQFAAYAIAIFNSIFPMFAKMLTDFESHSSEGGKQRSLYMKIAFFRWVNTAVVITLIFPFTATINGKLIPQIEALFFAEIVTTTVVQLLDPAGHFERHFLAPRAPTQDAMNLKMQGSLVELAERYTNMTKILFLALWYCAIYPAALVLCSLALFINYYADRFCLMRSWKRQSMLGTQISVLSRKYFVSLAVLAMAVMSSYYWASFPFDNLCPTANSETTIVEGEFLLELKHIEAEFYQNYTWVVNPPMYEYCLQNFFLYPKDQWVFPFIHQFQNPEEEWMSPAQERITTLYGWTSVAVIVIVLVSFVYRFIMELRGVFQSTYTACGEDQGIAFSDLASKSVYVPEVRSPAFAYPLLAVSGLDAVDKDLLEWTDHDRPHVFYDLTKDAEVLLRGTDVSSKVVFSTMAHWPPQKKKAD